MTKHTYTKTQPKQQRRKEMTALRPIKKKIQSERGASITFALLLFLVCAVVGSAVLTAGTAAAGRLSQIAEMDQRYYSVNSAARLLISLVEGDKVNVKKTAGASGDTTFSYKLNGNEIEIVETTEFQSLALEAAHQLCQYQLDDSSPAVQTDGSIRTKNLTLGQSGVSDDPLKVNIKEKIFPDNRLQFTVSRDDKYLVELVFQNIGVDYGTEKNFEWVLNDVDSLRVTPSTSNQGG